MFPPRLRHRLAGLLLCISPIAVTQALPVSHQYYRFTPTKLRDGTANSVQLSEFEFYLGAVQSGAPFVSNPGGNNPGGETPALVVDGELTTKWLDFNKQALVFDFGSPETIDGYRWATANDEAGRDPVGWRLEGSDDKLNWTLLDDQTGEDFAVPIERFTFTPTFDFNQQPDEPLIQFMASDGVVTSEEAIGVSGGTQVTLAWDVSDSTNVTLDTGSGPQSVSAAGSTMVTPGTTQTYTLEATNVAGTAAASVTVYVGAGVIPPVINEFMADGTRNGALVDEDGNASDWLELHNPNAFAISVGGYYLSDDALFPTRWQIPAGTVIGPDDYLIVFPSGKDRAVAGAELHTNFLIEKDGEYLGLTVADGSTVVDEYAPMFPAQFEDVSYGRVPPVAGNTRNFFIAPTPGFANDTPPGPPGEKVTIVTPAQTFMGSIDVAMSVTSPTAVIRYTTDGSLPDETSAVYAGPITLTDSALVRARSYDPGFAQGEVRAEAFIELDAGLAAQTSDLPVVIVENFGAGAVPNGRSLQASYFTLHEPDVLTGRTDLTTVPIDANRAGIKRRGSSTLNDPKGNYRIEFWQDGSEEDKNINLLGMSDHDEWILFAPYNFDRSLVRIPFIHDLSNAIGTYASKGRFCEVYLNTGGGPVSLADYQGVYVLQERITRDPNRVDVEPLDTNDLIEPSVTGGYILSIDHHILVTFSKDPDALRLSTYLYKPRGGKLAFGPIWDFDRTMGCDGDPRAADPTNWDPPNETAQFFQYDYWGRLFQDANFMQKWIDRWQFLRDGEFSNASLVARVDALAAEVHESQPRNAAKWTGVAPNGGPLSALDGWDGEVDHLKNWLTQRAAWIDTQFTPRPLLQAGGAVTAGAGVTAAPLSGTMYYTVDGSDPRLPGGGINPSAVAIGGGTSAVTLVSESAAAVEALRPTSAVPGPTAWTVTGFDSAGWQTGSFGVGYEDGFGYGSLINIDVGNGDNSQPTSVYVRVPFTVANPSSLTSLTLRVKYDDGFIAYLNGTRVDSANAPASPVWNSNATASHSDSVAVNFVEFDISAHLGELVAGDNVLAIHSLNRGTANSTNDGSTNNDMLLSAELVAGQLVSGPGLTINETTTVTARALDGTDWSGPLTASYVVGVPASAASLVVSEMMYHPSALTAAEVAAGVTMESDFEFMELMNVSGQAIDLAGVVISEVFDFAFSNVPFRVLGSREVVLLVRGRL